MRSIVKKISIFACVIGLLLTGVIVEAQDPPDMVATGIVTNTYAAKFICGVQPNASLFSVPDAQAGHYSTKINVHNNTGKVIRFRKKVIRLKGGQVPTPPAWTKLEALNPDWAMEVVCRDIYGHLGIPLPVDDGTVQHYPPYIEGFVIFEVFFGNPLPPDFCPPSDPLDVEGIYTYRAEPVGTDAVSINVVVFPAKSNRYLIPLVQVADTATVSPAAATKQKQ